MKPSQEEIERHHYQERLRVVLDPLGNRYRRRFDTHWDFVCYAQQQRLYIDFTTPPKRPERKLPLLFVERKQ